MSTEKREDDGSAPISYLDVRDGTPVATEQQAAFLEANDAYARGVAEGRRQAAAEIAEKIRNELVCCDIYERLAPLRVEVAAAKPGWGEA